MSIVLALALSLQMLRLGFILDDFKLVAHAEGLLPQKRPLDYFSFARDPEELQPLVDRGPFPWWTLPGLKLAFFRPLSAATIAFDTAVFGRAAWPAHLHSIAWYVALVGVAFLFYRRALPAAVAGLALVGLTLDNVLWVPVGWLANRNALIAAVPTVLGVCAHLRWREDGWRPGRVWAPLGLAVGLMGGESALAYLAYVAAWEWFARKPGRVAALAPLAAVVVAWALVYRWLGYGAGGSGTYVDPGAAPLDFVAIAGPRLLVLLGALTLKVSSDWWIILPAVRVGMYVGGALGVAFVVWLARRCWPALEARERLAVKWLSLGSVLAVLPVLATFPADRLLLPASFGAIGVLALLLQTAWRTKTAKAAVVFLVVTQGLVPVPSWIIGPEVLRRVGANGLATVLAAPPAMLTKRVLLLNAGEFAAALYGPLLLRMEGRPMPPRWWLLSLAPKPHRLTRVGPQALELEVVGGRMLDQWYERLVRSERFPFAVGQAVQLDGATVTVLAEDGGKPTRIRIDLAAAMEEHALIRWKDGAMVEVPAPAVGETVEIEEEPSPLEMKL